MTATQAPTPGPLSGDFNVEEYVADYEFRADEGSYSPTENERVLLIDAIHGAFSEAGLSLAPTAPVEAGGSEREVVARLEAELAHPCRVGSKCSVDADDLRALLSARPLALGGQHSGGEVGQ